MYNDYENLTNLFEFVWDEISKSGGDGDAIIVFKQRNISEVAQQFEEWESKNSILSKWPHTRLDFNDNHVLFHDGSNENITFISKEESQKETTGCFPPWIDVTIEVY